jgi:dTDP-4-amino-4,6-dideoxygalactose transaminase
MLLKMLQEEMEMLLKPKDQGAVALPNTIEFIDLKSQQQRIRPQIEAALKKVLDHGMYIMGPEVKEFEARMAEFCGVKHAISCANGTDALGLGLMAKGVKPGDAIFVPSFTFAATAEVVAWMGASAIFIDSLEDTLNMDPESLEQGIATAKKRGLKPTGIIPVDLFGQPADYDAIDAIAQKHGLWVMADGAQSFGAYYKSRRVGNIGDMATTSFFPAKPLGCYGDGGAIFTNDDELAHHIRSIRVHGQGEDKYDNVRVGMNGRLDTMQAAILIEKLNIFDDEIRERQKVAQRYNEGFKDIFTVPFVAPETTSVWAQYTVILPESLNRSALMAALKEAGIPTIIYYIKPLHLQTAYKHHPTATEGALSICERLSHQVLSFPMHAYLSSEQQEYIIETTKAIVGKM